MGVFRKSGVSVHLKFLADRKRVESILIVCCRKNRLNLSFKEILKPVEQLGVFRDAETDENHKNDGNPN